MDAGIPLPISLPWPHPHNKLENQSTSKMLFFDSDALSFKSKFAPQQEFRWRTSSTKGGHVKTTSTFLVRRPGQCGAVCHIFSPNGLRQVFIHPIYIKGWMGCFLSVRQNFRRLPHPCYVTSAAPSSTCYTFCNSSATFCDTLNSSSPTS